MKLKKGHYHNGRFIPQNPKKYAGDVRQIYFRSEWEYKFMLWLDKNNAVLRWGSESFPIPYVSPIDNKVHKYFPDMVVMYMDNTGMIKKEIIEIKPHKQTMITPKMSIQEKIVVAVNQAKWKYASEWAERNGAQFRVITEKQLFKQGPQKKKGTSL